MLRRSPEPTCLERPNPKYPEFAQLGTLGPFKTKVLLMCWTHLFTISVPPAHLDERILMWYRIRSLFESQLWSDEHWHRTWPKFTIRSLDLTNHFWNSEESPSFVSMFI